MSVTSVI